MMSLSPISPVVAVLEKLSHWHREGIVTWVTSLGKTPQDVRWLNLSNAANRMSFDFKQYLNVAARFEGDETAYNTVIVRDLLAEIRESE